LKDAETHEVVCIARFKFTIALQILSAWGLRYSPPPMLNISEHDSPIQIAAMT
jgi:hypothetical protein